MSEGTTSMLTDVPLASIPPKCQCGAMLRPDVVWFGESIPTQALEQSFRALEMCDTLIVVGTSGAVYPVASFPETVKGNGGFVIEVNMEETPISRIAEIPSSENREKFCQLWWNFSRFDRGGLVLFAPCFVVCGVRTSSTFATHMAVGTIEFH